MILTPCPSPNFGERRCGAVPDMVVLHYTAMESAAAALERLCAKEHEVSAHYLISESGDVFSLVAEDMRAWHAGAGQWGAVTDVNSRSIGIELANAGNAPFSEPQMAALEQLLVNIMARWAIRPERIIGHSDMAPGRKADPGSRFDWRRLARQGLSVWPDFESSSEASDIAAFTKAAHAFGYPTDVPHEVLLAAFRLRFCPWNKGSATRGDDIAIADLATRYPASSCLDGIRLAK